MDVARANVRKAKAFEKQHQTSTDTQVQKLKAAELNVNRTQVGYNVYLTNLREAKAAQLLKEKVEAAIENDPERFRMETAYLTAVEERDAEKLALTALQTADIGAGVAIADAQVKQAESQVAEAQTAIDLCTVRARQPGTVERVNVSPGAVLGIGTQEPAVVLVPAGPMVVRAEVEAEFAHRVGPDKKGKTVTIYDNSDDAISYQGVVRGIGTTFLPKRSLGGGFVPNETRVLEVVIEVTDPHPPGRPPLRVGQKVRVNFGQ